MDMVTGLPRSHGFLGYLNMVDTYSGYVIPVAVKSENSQDIANVIEQYLIRPFGPPIQISSDNASNLQGPPIRKLLNFYNISQRFTVPYSPESHGLVEIQNRYVTELVRIFTDQFQCLWPDVLTLSAMVLNSVPRPQLMGHSPYFIMFGHEPFGNENMDIINEKFLDINDFVAHSQNNKNYVKLVREFLVLKRAQNNKNRNRKMKSFPKNTLVFVKDNRPKIHKKSKPVYFKVPEKVITEYSCTVYTTDIFGKVKKHSKNNLKKASDRSLELFGRLPEDIKLILGDEFNTEKWNEIKDSGIVPLYLQDIDISVDLERVTRNNLPKDTHLLNVPIDPTASIPADGPNVNKDDDDENEEEDFDEIFSDKILENLNVLNDNDMLNGNVELRDVPKLIENLNVGVPPPGGSLIEDGDVTVPLTGPAIPHPSEIHIGNILPEGTTRRRTIRFDLPVTR